MQNCLWSFEMESTFNFQNNAIYLFKFCSFKPHKAVKNINVYEDSKYQGLKTQTNSKWDFQHTSWYLSNQF